MKIEHTKDIPDRFFSDLKEESAHRKIDALALLSVMFSESGLYASAQNPHGHATGILQFMPAILKNLGWTKGEDAFRHLDAAQQLPFVFAYLSSWQKAAGGEFASAARIYQATFLPATLSLGSAPDYVLAARGGRLGWAYEANAGFDVNRDKAITIAELGLAIERNCRGKRWAECVERLTGKRAGEVLPVSDLSTVAGMQAALSAVGFPCEVDGANGPKTRAALVAFQEKYSVHPIDGIYGPTTRGALEAELAKVRVQARESIPEPVEAAAEPSTKVEGKRRA